LPESNGRRPPRHGQSATIDADADDHARRLLAERWPGDDDLYLVREEGLRLTQVPDRGGSRASRASRCGPSAGAGHFRQRLRGQ
jgi:hypothetical protein